MKNIWKITTLVLAIAVAVFAYKLADTPKVQPTEQLSKEDVVFENIMTRSSVRAFTTQPVEDEKIEKMLRAAMAAPTAGNRQPWEFIVIKDRAVLDSFPTILGGAKMAAKAQLAIAICGIPAKSYAHKLAEYWVQDCCAATENLLLSAHSMGLGAVWCGAYPDSQTNRVEKISKLLDLPEGVYALNVIVIGYPRGEPRIKDKWDTNKIHYDRY